MIKLPCQCKFCNRPLTVEVDPAGAAMFGDLENFVTGLACCNKCAELRESCVRTVDFIDSKKFDNAMAYEQKRLLVAEAAQKFAHRICDFYRVQRTFDPKLVDLFFDKRADAVARTYENHVRKSQKMRPLPLKSDPVKDSKRNQDNPAWIDSPEYREAA